MGQSKGRKYKTKTRQKQPSQRVGVTAVTRNLSAEPVMAMETNNAGETTDRPLIRINREQIKAELADICKRCSTDTISVEVTEDTRKLDAGIIYYIVHIRKADTRRTPTRKTGIYFSRIKDCIHVQVINGTSMVLLYSNYSDNSQTEVFKYLENMIRKDMEFYQNTLEARKSYPKKKGR